jgi:hypothetical protein
MKEREASARSGIARSREARRCAFRKIFCDFARPSMKKKNAARPLPRGAQREIECWSVFPVGEGIAAGSAKAGNQVADSGAAPKQRVDQPG